MSYSLLSATQILNKMYKNIVTKSIQVGVLEPKRKFHKGSHRVTHFSQPIHSPNTSLKTAIIKPTLILFTKLRGSCHGHSAQPYDLPWPEGIPDKCWCQGINVTPLKPSGITTEHFSDLN